MVTTTSLIPHTARNTPGIKPHSPPPTIPARTAAGMVKKERCSCQRTPTHTAHTLPTTSCPSAPILNNPIWDVNATASPVSISGRHVTTPSPIYLKFHTDLPVPKACTFTPNIERTKAMRMYLGCKPDTAITTAPTANPKITAKQGISSAWYLG